MNHTNNEHEETTNDEDHPAAARAAPAHHLAPKIIRSSPSSGTGASSVPTTSTTVASLIQSAAKISLLDDDRHQHSSTEQPANTAAGAAAAAATHNAARLFDDDEYDDNHGTIGESPSLKSLQKQALPILPDEQDRKRFVGCLAAVLASLYDYDDEHAEHGDENDYDPDDMSNYPADSVSDSFYEDWDEDVEDNDYSSNQTRTSENYGSSDNKTTAAAPSPDRRGPKRQFLRRNQRNSPAKQQRPPVQAVQTTTSSSRRPSTASDAASLAQQRHRRRRYEVYSRFLASSAELLLLDESQGKCFVPMLSKLASSSSSVNKRKKKNAPPAGFASDRDFLEYQMDRIEHLRVFWEALGPGAGLRCLSMFLLQHLLHGSSSTGYDARIRHAVKTLGVLVLLHDRLLEEEEDGEDDEQGCHSSSGVSQQLRRSASTERRGFWASPRQHDPNMNLVTMATRRFESLEHFIASKLIELSKAERELEMEHQRQQQRGKRTNGAQKSGSLASREASANSRDRIIRGLKIGGTAVAAGTLFAITGGLAAPGIAAGVATIVGTTAVATAAAALTSTVAVTTIFGVGGGGLVAYKMQRRTVGLTEFEFCKEESPYQKQQRGTSGNDDDRPDAELFSTICMSGWLRDDHDFQRPWGIMPTRPPIDDRLELLERFYAIHRPGHILKCPRVLESWKGEEKELWRLLRKNYGRDPDHLFPLVSGPRFRGSLTHEQQEVVSQLFELLGCTVSVAGRGDEYEAQQQQRPNAPFERMGFGPTSEFHSIHSNCSLFDSLHGPHVDDLSESFADGSQKKPSSLSQDGEEEEDEAKLAKIEHLATVWDYQTTYGGELYSVRWESDLLEELCDSVVDLASDVVTGATTHLLKFTAFSALAAAMALPVALKGAANMIDGTWTLVVERTDAAGAELAKSLLFSSAGNRPVNLVGFSFGARAMYSCLKQLAMYQEKWEDYQERRHQSSANPFRHRKRQSKEETDAFFERMREPASIVGDVILMGLPNHLSLSSWKACRRIVAGRLVNCYSRKDLILSLMYQIKKFGLKPVCGTCAVDVPGVENIDVTDLVSGHQDYTLVTGEILKRARHGEPFLSEGTDTGIADEEKRQIAQLRESLESENHR